MMQAVAAQQRQWQPAPTEAIVAYTAQTGRYC